MFCVLGLRVLPPMTAQAQFDYTVNNDGTVTITGYTGSGGAVIIPGMLDGQPVTTIGDEAFINQTTITSVAIADSVTNVGYYSFQLCTGLTNLSLGSGVVLIQAAAFYGCNGLISVTGAPNLRTVGDDAFEGCWSLTNFNFPSGLLSIGDWSFNNTGLIEAAIPASLTNIGDAAFGQTSSLHAVIVDPANAFYTSSNGILFNKNQTVLIQYPPSATGGTNESYSIPNGVVSIGDFAFDECYLTNITIPDTVTDFGQYAFEECPLSSITIPAGITTISGYTFEYCSYLTSIVIPAGVTNLADGAFSYCSSLSNAYFLGNAPAADSAAFEGDHVTINYLPGTSGWLALGLPTAPWTLPYPVILSGTTTLNAGQFGFTISWATNVPVTIDVSSDLLTWVAVATNTLTNGTSSFSDTRKYANRFYRLRAQ
jgi:hypothetical protein